MPDAAPAAAAEAADIRDTNESVKPTEIFFYLGCRLIVGIKIVLFKMKGNSLSELQMCADVAPYQRRKSADT